MPSISLTSLISYWSLDEASGNAIDAHGTNSLNDNSTVGATTGKVSGARDFSGSSEYFDRPSNSDLQVDSTSATWAGWVYLNNASNGGSVLSKSDFPWDHTEYYIRYSSSRFNISGSTGFASADTFGAPSSATWYFLVCEYDFANSLLRIGVNDGTMDAASGTITSGASTFTMGETTGAFLPGRLDEWSFWKRLLTSGEKTWLYNSGSGRSYTDIVTEANSGAKRYLLVRN